MREPKYALWEVWIRGWEFYSWYEKKRKAFIAAILLPDLGYLEAAAKNSTEAAESLADVLDCIYPDHKI